MKTLLILLFLVLPISAQDDIWTADIIQEDAIMMTDSLEWLWGWEVPIRDTTQWYIKEIKQKCDTIHKWSYHDCRKCRIACSALICTPQVRCVDDTMWVKKIQIYLTPAELGALMKMIGEREQWELDKNVGRWSPIKD